MTKYSLLVQPKTKFDDGNQTEEALFLSIDSRPLGWLYIHRESYTLAWDGVLDFDQLDKEALQLLPQHLDKNVYQDLIQKNSTFDTHVWLAVTANENTEDYEAECSLLNKSDRDLYDQILTHPNAIVFARYDVKNQGHLEYALTAQNYKNLFFKSRKNNELSVIQPIEKSITSQFLDWVISHHTDAPNISKAIDYRAAAAELTQELQRGKHLNNYPAIPSTSA